jgi:hypothetical protein
MSQCTADRPEQSGCRFYEKSMVADRCMHCIESISNHCDSHKAQMYGHHPHGNPDFHEEELLVDLDEFLEEDKPARSCINCILYTCGYIIHENQQAQPRGGLTHDDLVKIAGRCEEYEDEQTMQQKINLSLRGINP